MSEWHTERRVLYDRIAELTEALAHAEAVNAVMRYTFRALADDIGETIDETAEP